MKTMLSVLRVLSLCVMTSGLSLEQLCPEPLEQASQAPWTEDEWPEVPSSRISFVYPRSIAELPNNSFVFAPSKKVLWHY